MDFNSKYNISTELEYQPLELINIPDLIASCQDDWKNISLCQVNDCVVRLGVIKGEFHWHKHDKEDEFFYVVSGLLYIDLENKTIQLQQQQGFLVPKGIRHRTRAPEQTAIIMIEGSSVTPTGD